MITLKTIVVATDFSEDSAKALRYGVEFATKFEATLHLFHAIDTTPIVYDETTYYPADLLMDLEAAAVKQLDDVRIESAGDLQVIRKVSQGPPFVEIIHYAKNNQADLIIMGTHGRGAIAHMLLGSVAEKVVRKAHCPVLVVRDQEHDFVMP